MTTRYFKNGRLYHRDDAALGRKPTPTAQLIAEATWTALKRIQRERRRQPATTQASQPLSFPGPSGPPRPTGGTSPEAAKLARARVHRENLLAAKHRANQNPLIQR